MVQYRNLALFTLFLLAAATTYSQRPEELLSKWAEKSPIEKVYLHFDRENYIAGETAWFKAYLYSEQLPDTISSILYVELRNENSILLDRKVLPVIVGGANGQFELPDTLVAGFYSVNAYSPTMLNNGIEFTYRKKIFIYGKENKAVEKNTAGRRIKMEFFPEGGNLVNGFTNTIAFKVTNEKGQPESIKGKIVDEQNNKLADASTYHDGMGMIELVPESGKKYYLLPDGETLLKYELPLADNEGIVLTVIPHPQGSFFEVHQRSADPAKRAAYMIGQMQHHIVFRQNLDQAKEEQQGVLNTTKIGSGILQVTVFNNDGIPLAERLCFVNNKEYLQSAGLRLDTISFDEKSRNHFKVILKDTIQGSLSVSVTDAGFEGNLPREETIVSNFLLSSDLKGSIHNPSWYFNANNDSASTAIDLVMMTNGWRRFRWNELAQKVNAPVKFHDPAYITIAGRINLQGTKKAFAEKQIMAIISAEGLRKSMQLITTDKQGNFKLDSVLFFGKGRILFVDIRGKKSQYIDVETISDSINKQYVIKLDESKALFKFENTAGSKMQSDYDAIKKAAGVMLEEVKVKAIKKTPTQLLDENYTSGMFGGFSDKTIDLVNTEEIFIGDNVFDYLSRTITGLDFSSDGGNFVIYYRQQASMSSMGAIPMIVYLNEVETDAGIIATLPAREIALVKLYNHFAGATGNAPGGVLSIYTRKGSDIINSSRGNFLNYNGFSVIKEYYSPDYKNDQSHYLKPDNRITLMWRPNIFVNNVDPVIPVSFYNSDRTKRFRIVVEGMTTSGKMISVEKIVSSSTK